VGAVPDRQGDRRDTVKDGGVSHFEDAGLCLEIEDGGTLLDVGEKFLVAE